jgi:hypothetical protein
MTTSNRDQYLANLLQNAQNTIIKHQQTLQDHAKTYKSIQEKKSAVELPRLVKICQALENSAEEIAELRELAASFRIPKYREMTKQELCRKISDLASVAIGNIEANEIELPIEFTDIVTKDPLYDPVILSDGFSYNSNTKKLLFLGHNNPKSPKNPNVNLDPKICVFNWNLRLATLNWLAKHGLPLEKELNLDFINKVMQLTEQIGHVYTPAEPRIYHNFLDYQNINQVIPEKLMNQLQGAIKTDGDVMSSIFLRLLGFGYVVFDSDAAADEFLLTNQVWKQVKKGVLYFDKDRQSLQILYGSNWMGHSMLPKVHFDYLSNVDAMKDNFPYFLSVFDLDPDLLSEYG